MLGAKAALQRISALHNGELSSRPSMKSKEQWKTLSFTWNTCLRLT